MMTPIAQVHIIPATAEDYQRIQNLAQFYVYDASRQLGFSVSDNGLYEPRNYMACFKEPEKSAFLLKVDEEICGFVLLDQNGLTPQSTYKIDQFFILGKFQGQGLGKQVAYSIWNRFPGNWEVPVIPDNTPALLFWEKVINSYTSNNYKRETYTVSCDRIYPERLVFRFKTPPMALSRIKS